MAVRKKKAASQPVYRDLKDLEVASYFANPPHADQLALPAPDGSVMTILACTVPPDLWSWNKDLKCLVHKRTGHTAAWAFEHNALFQPTVPVTHVPDWKRLGYASLKDYQMTLRAQDGVEPQVWRELTTIRPSEPVVRRNAKRVSWSDMTVRPSEYFDAADLKEVVERAGQAVVDLCAIADFLPYDQQLKCKLARAMRELATREIDSTIDYGMKLKREVEALEIANTETEFDHQAFERKERQMHQLRSQVYLMKRIEQGFREAYDTVIDQYEETHGKKWFDYKELGERATGWRKVKNERRAAEIRRHAMADVLMPVEYAAWMRSLREYDPGYFARGTGKGGGVDGTPPGLTKRMEHGKKAKGNPDDWHTEDSVHRVLGTHRSLLQAYGSDGGDWDFTDD